MNRDTVVRTGLRVLNEVGLDALTLKKIADELDVQPPALYWHFESKQDLIDEMATTLLTDGIEAIPPDIEWRAFAVMYGEGLRQLLRRYRDGAKMFAGTYLTDTSVYRHQEAALLIFTSGGFALADAATALHTIYCYTIGFVIEEQAVHPRPGERAPRYDPARRAERIAHENVPLAAEAGAAFFEDFNARFTRGLQAIVDGVAQWAGGAPSADGPAA